MTGRPRGWAARLVASQLDEPTPNRTVAGGRAPGGEPGRLTLVVELAPDLDGDAVHEVVGRLRAAVAALDRELRGGS